MQNSHVAVIVDINEISLSQLTDCGVFPTFLQDDQNNFLCVDFCISSRTSRGIFLKQKSVWGQPQTKWRWDETWMSSSIQLLPAIGKRNIYPDLRAETKNIISSLTLISIIQLRLAKRLGTVNFLTNEQPSHNICAVELHTCIFLLKVLWFISVWFIAVAWYNVIVERNLPTVTLLFVCHFNW